jgi:hypothetical protein
MSAATHSTSPASASAVNSRRTRARVAPAKSSRNGGQERLELVVGRWLPKAAVGIDPDQSRHPLAQAQGRLDDDIAAHGVPDQHQLAQAQLLGHGHDVVAEGGHGPGPAADA